MTGALIPAFIAAILPPAAGWLAGKRLGLFGACVIQSSCAAGVLAVCVIRGQEPGAIAAALATVGPWPVWLPAVQRRICSRRLARFGDLPATMAGLAHGGPPRREPGGPPQLPPAAVGGELGRITSITGGLGCVLFTSPGEMEHPAA